MRLALALLLVGRVATARSFDDTELDPPPQLAAAPTSPPPAAPPPPPRPEARWRAEGGFGVRFGSQLIDGRDVGTVVPLHLDAGLRTGRWLVYGEYDLMSFSWPTPAVALSGQLGGGTTTGLLQRLGASARVAIGRTGEKDMDSNVWAEVGAGLEHVAWDAGGRGRAQTSRSVWARRCSVRATTSTAA